MHAGEESVGSLHLQYPVGSWFAKVRLGMKLDFSLNVVPVLKHISERLRTVPSNTEVFLRNL